jgi:hypothetical protein
MSHHVVAEKTTSGLWRLATPVDSHSAGLIWITRSEHPERHKVFAVGEWEGMKKLHLTECSHIERPTLCESVATILRSLSNEQFDQRVTPLRRQASSEPATLLDLLCGAAWRAQGNFTQTEFLTVCRAAWQRAEDAHAREKVSKT